MWGRLPRAPCYHVRLESSPTCSFGRIWLCFRNARKSFGRPHSRVFRAHSWLCRLGAHYRMPGIKPRSSVCKARALHCTITLAPNVSVFRGSCQICKKEIVEASRACGGNVPVRPSPTGLPWSPSLPFSPCGGKKSCEVLSVGTVRRHRPCTSQTLMTARIARNRVSPAGTRRDAANQLRRHWRAQGASAGLHSDGWLCVCV